MRRRGVGGQPRGGGCGSLVRVCRAGCEAAEACGKQAGRRCAGGRRGHPARARGGDIGGGCVSGAGAGGGVSRWWLPAAGWALRRCDRQRGVGRRKRSVCWARGGCGAWAAGRRGWGGETWLAACGRGAVARRLTARKVSANPAPHFAAVAAGRFGARGAPSRCVAGGLRDAARERIAAAAAGAAHQPRDYRAGAAQCLPLSIYPPAGAGVGRLLRLPLPRGGAACAAARQRGYSRSLISGIAGSSSRSQLLPATLQQGRKRC